MTAQIAHDDTDATTWPVTKAVLDQIHAAEARAALEQIAAPKADASDKIRLMPVAGFQNATLVSRVCDVDIFGPNDTTVLDAGLIVLGAGGEIKSCLAPKAGLYPPSGRLRITPISNRSRWYVTAHTVDPVIINTPDTTATALFHDVEQIGPDPLAGYEEYSKPNWDLYGAQPITDATVEAARYFLEILPARLGAPHIAPGADGTIGLEWVFKDRPLRKLFIDIGPSYTWGGYWRRASGERQVIPHKAIDLKTKAELVELFQGLSE